MTNTHKPNPNIDPKTGKPFLAGQDSRTPEQRADDEASRPRGDGTVSNSGKPKS